MKALWVSKKGNSSTHKNYQENQEAHRDFIQDRNKGNRN